MRLTAAMIMLVCACGIAQASSLVAIAPPPEGSTGSLLQLDTQGEPPSSGPDAPAATRDSPSLVARGVAPTAKTGFISSAAAISARHRNQPVLVIRGGFAGGAGRAVEAPMPDAQDGSDTTQDAAAQEMPAGASSSTTARRP